jgi:hypothetical protein
MVSEKYEKLKNALMKASVEHYNRVEARQMKKVAKHSDQFNKSVDKLHEAIGKFEGTDKKESAEETAKEEKPNKIKDAFEAAKEEINYAITTFGIGQAQLYEQGKAYIDSKKKAKEEANSSVPRVDEKDAQTLPPKKKPMFTIVPDEKPASKKTNQKQQQSKKPTNNKTSSKKK